MILESSMIRSIQDLVLRYPSLIGFVVFCARWLIFVPLLWMLVRFRSADVSQRLILRRACLAALLAIFFAGTLAWTIGRLRPYESDPGIVLLIPPPWNHAFPSSHTASITALALSLADLHPWVGVITGVMAASVALGRVVAGAHYPTDILGGMCIGLVSYFVSKRLIQK